MSYKILPTKEFSKDFKKLDPQLQKKTKSKIEEVAEDPTRYKFLHYDLKGSCRENRNYSGCVRYCLGGG